MKNIGVDKKIVHFQKHIDRSHDAEEIGVQLVERDPEKVGYLNEEYRNGKP